MAEATLSWIATIDRAATPHTETENVESHTALKRQVALNCDCEAPTWLSPPVPLAMYSAASIPKLTLGWALLGSGFQPQHE